MEVNKHLIKTTTLDSSDKELINKIASWYLEEWGIPIEKTIHRLSNQSKDDVCFQVILSYNNQTIATGGLYHQVGILQVYERFKRFQPWVALLFTERNFRNKGIGQTLLLEIEKRAKEKGYDKIYLFTFTAESLYIRNGWKEIERVIFRNHDTVVMEKVI